MKAIGSPQAAKAKLERASLNIASHKVIRALVGFPVYASMCGPWRRLGMPLRIIEISGLRLVAVSHHLRQNVERTVGCGGLGSGPVLARREGIHLRLTRERMIDPEPSPGKTGHVAKGW